MTSPKNADVIRELIDEVERLEAAQLEAAQLEAAQLEAARVKPGPMLSELEIGDAFIFNRDEENPVVYMVTGHRTDFTETVSLGPLASRYDWYPDRRVFVVKLDFEWELED
jgi:hypothetical protein